MIVDLQSGLSIPDDWVTLLKQLQEKDPSAVLAGGAIRDIYCARKPVHDLDFFVKAGTNAGFSQFRAQGSQTDYQGMTYVEGIQWYPSALPLPCNVITGSGYDSVYQLLETFDYGLCQIAFDGMDIIRTGRFDWDYKHGVMTLRLTARQGDRRDLSLARFERWREKYPEFTLIEAPIQQEDEYDGF